jgi:hypothetical protein
MEIQVQRKPLWATLAVVAFLIVLRPVLASWLESVSQMGGLPGELASHWYLVLLLAPFPFIAWHLVGWAHQRSHLLLGVHDSALFSQNMAALEEEQKMHRSQIIVCFGGLYALCLGIYWIIFSTISSL